MITAPDHLLSLPEWVALPEDRDRVYELQEGVLTAGPRPIEVIAEGTRLTDTVIKPVEYARAGIPWYWVVDVGAPLSIATYRLEGGRYQEAATTTGMFETTEPFSLRVDVAALARRA